MAAKKAGRTLLLLYRSSLQRLRWRNTDLYITFRILHRSVYVNTFFCKIPSQLLQLDLQRRIHMDDHRLIRSFYIALPDRLQYGCVLPDRGLHTVGMGQGGPGQLLDLIGIPLDQIDKGFIPRIGDQIPVEQVIIFHKSVHQAAGPEDLPLFFQDLLHLPDRLRGARLSSLLAQYPSIAVRTSLIS